MICCNMSNQDHTPGHTGIQAAYLKACLSELEALKPGNVHLFADGHGMQVQDFIDSAEVSAPALCDDPALGTRTLGRRMLAALQATHARVGCNTNLGIILLAGPIVQAAYDHPGQPSQRALSTVLHQTTVDDADQVYQGIRLVKPAGMGHRDHHDVAEAPDITLLQAMKIASSYDSVARLYTTDYAVLWQHALPLYRSSCARWERPAWALTAVYLYWLSHWLDSHVMRKYGQPQAAAIQHQAQMHYRQFTALDNPKHYMAALLAWDAELKQAGINPGTSADLTVTTALLAQLQDAA